MKYCIILFLAFFTATSCAVSLEYSCMQNGHFLQIHILRVDPHEYDIKAVKAESRDSVLNLCVGVGGIAAINGGFWKKSGAPAGLLKVDNTYYGLGTKERAAIGWSNGGRHVAIDRIAANDHKDTITLTPVFDNSVTWEAFTYIVGGTPLLVKNDVIIDDFSSEQTLTKFLTKNYARTAIGITESGEWVLVVVEGSALPFIGGMSIPELARLMYDLGCVEALNLDGGSSSTMVLGDLVVNSTYGTTYEERHFVDKVSDAIVIVPRR